MDTSRNRDNLQAALAELNRATAPRQYSIAQDGSQYALVMPSGGKYPAVDANAMANRIVTLRIAAEGRGVR